MNRHTILKYVETAAPSRGCDLTLRPQSMAHAFVVVAETALRKAGRTVYRGLRQQIRAGRRVCMCSSCVFPHTVTLFTHVALTGSCERTSGRA